MLLVEFKCLPFQSKNYVNCVEIKIKWENNLIENYVA